MVVPGEPFTIRAARPTEVAVVHAFHSRYATDFIWPRSFVELDALVEAQSVQLALDHAGAIAAICYVDLADIPLEPMDRWELGGIFVRTDCRGLGLAEAVSKIALCAKLIAVPPTDATELVAHVHERNLSPRALLSNLGFSPTGLHEIPSKEAPPTMERNAAGEVVGDLFRFDFQFCVKHADWLHDFQETVSGRRGSAICRIDWPVFDQYAAQYIFALQEIGRGYRANR